MLSGLIILRPNHTFQEAPILWLGFKVVRLPQQLYYDVLVVSVHHDCEVTSRFWCGLAAFEAASLVWCRLKANHTNCEASLQLRRGGSFTVVRCPYSCEVSSQLWGVLTVVRCPHSCSFDELCIALLCSNHYKPNGSGDMPPVPPRFSWLQRLIGGSNNLGLEIRAVWKIEKWHADE